MTLSQRIDSDLKDAMRAKDAGKLGVLRMLKSAIKYAAIEKSGAEGELDDAEAVQVIRKQAKQRQDSIESFEKGGRAELAAKEKDELALLSAYLPQAMGADELAKAVRRSHCGSRRDLAGADGSGDEGASGQARWTGGWEDAEPGSAAAIGMKKTSNAERRTPNVELGCGFCVARFVLSDRRCGFSSFDVQRSTFSVGRFCCFR